MGAPFTKGRIPSTYQMPDEVTIVDKNGNSHRVVKAESMRRILMTIYNQINNPPASTVTNITQQSAPSTVYVANEVPKDSGDHQNFSIAHTPSPPTSLQLFVNKGAGGVPLQLGVDYTLFNNLITLTAAIVGSFTMWANYPYLPS